MLVLLPPSETKRDGGEEGSVLDLGVLSFPQLHAQRTGAIAALARLSRNVGESNRALGLGVTQRFEIDRNRALKTSPIMPAIDRFTGVLYDGLDAGTLDSAARDWIAGNVVMHSALFGLIGAADPIPAYRLSHDSRLPGMQLVRHWRAPISSVLAEQPGFVLDLRSEAYESMGPAPARENSHYLRVVSATSDGTKRALNHFNKKGKGELLRALAEDAVEVDSVDALLDWASGRGIRIERSAQGSDPQELFLVV